MADRGWQPATSGGLLYLDLATVAGWAYGSSQDGFARYGAVELPSYDQTGATMAGVYEMTCDLMEFYRPRRLINEAPLVTNYRDRSGNIQHVVSNDKAISCLRGMIEVARCAAFHFQVSTGEFEVQTVRKVMRGFPAYDRKATDKRDWKGIVVAWCVEHGFEPPDHNAADAIVGLEYSFREFEGGTLMPALIR